MLLQGTRICADLATCVLQCALCRATFRHLPAVRHPKMKTRRSQPKQSRRQTRSTSQARRHRPSRRRTRTCHHPHHWRRHGPAKGSRQQKVILIYKVRDTPWSEARARQTTATCVGGALRHGRCLSSPAARLDTAHELSYRLPTAAADRVLMAPYRQVRRWCAVGELESTNRRGCDHSVGREACERTCQRVEATEGHTHL